MIYFDHSATTPVDKKVLDKMLPYFNKNFGNPSSIHNFGQIAIAGVDKARKQISNFLNCEPEEVVFTSGATESNNLAIFGFLKAFLKNSKNKKKPHFISSIIEHDAVIEPFMELESRGYKVTYLKTQKNGVIDIEEFRKAIQDNTALVSLMYLNSEVGSIQPIREVGKIIKKINAKRLTEWKKMRVRDRGARPDPIYFHSDATQALNFLNCDIKYLHLDMMSFSAHKIYGPKGVGALFVKKGTPLAPAQLGGHHENNRRSGTINSSGIVGFGEAVDLLNGVQEKTNQKIAKLRKKLVDGIIKNIPDAHLNTDIDNASPAHAHFSFAGAEGEAVLVNLDMEGIAVSTGSACASSSHKASRVLIAMGIPVELAHSSIRFSLGKNNTLADIQKLIKVLPPIIKRIRKMNPIYENK